MSLRVVLVAAATAVLIAACGGADGADGDLLQAAPAGSEAAGDGSVGERLPAVDLEDLETGAVSDLSAIEGPAVINLWATWCPPCRAEIPDFEEVHRARADEIRFVGINVGEASEKAAEFLDQVGATYDQFLDADGEVSTELRATTMPLTVVIDARGLVTERHLGPLDQDGLNAAIDEALSS